MAGAIDTPSDTPIDTPIDTWGLVLRRLRDDWQLILSIFLGILVATTLISGAPVYLDSLARQSIATTIDSTVARRTDGFLTIVTELRSVPVEDQQIQSSQAAYLNAIERNVSEIHDTTQRHLITPNSVVALPDPVTGGIQSRGRLVEGFLQHYSNIEQQVTFLDGRMADVAVGTGTRGPMLEAVISKTLAVAFDDLGVGEIVVVSPSVDAPVGVSARIVGIFEPIDPSEGYWQGDAERFVNPRVPDPDGDDPEPQPLLLGMFVTEEAMVGALGTAHPGTVVNSTWYGAVDPEAVKRWSSAEMRERMDALQEELAISMPGSILRSGVNILLRDFERRSFLSSVPLLLLLAVMGVTVVYFSVHDRLVPGAQAGERRRPVPEQGQRSATATEALFDRRGPGHGSRRRRRAFPRHGRSCAGRQAALFPAHHGWFESARRAWPVALCHGRRGRASVPCRIRRTRGPGRQVRGDRPLAEGIASAGASFRPALLRGLRAPGDRRSPVQPARR